MSHGFEVKFGGKAVTFFPLSLQQLKELAADIEVFARLTQHGANSAEQFAAVSRVFLASAQRGNKAVTQDDVDAVVDLDNLQDIMKAVMGKRTFQLSEGDAGPTSPRIGGESSQA